MAAQIPPKVSRIVDIFVSLAAAVVIVGALFKILHLGGVMGNYMIGIGLGVEAFLFFIAQTFERQGIKLPYSIDFSASIQ